MKNLPKPEQLMALGPLGNLESILTHALGSPSYTTAPSTKYDDNRLHDEIELTHAYHLANQLNIQLLTQLLRK